MIQTVRDLFKSHSIVRMAFGSILFLSIKLVWVYFSELTAILPAYISYALLHIVLFFISWVYHTIVTFEIKGDSNVFVKYIYVNMSFKLLDYLLFLLLTYVANSYPVLSVLISSVIVFLLRYLMYSKVVFGKVSESRVTTLS